MTFYEWLSSKEANNKTVKQNIQELKEYDIFSLMLVAWCKARS